MSFKNLANLVNGITQKYFGEAAIYKSGDIETPIKAIFEMQWIESNGVSSQSMTCQIRSTDIPDLPKKNDQVIRGTTTYLVSVSQTDAEEDILTLVLKD